MIGTVDAIAGGACTTNGSGNLFLENFIDRAPLEIAEQSCESRLGSTKIDVVSKPRFYIRPIDSRLPRIEFPRVKIEY